MNKTALVLAFFLAAVLAGIFMRYTSQGSPVARENFMQQPVGMPLNSGGIGPYDQVNIGGGISGWASTEPSGGVAPLPSQSLDSNKLMFLVDNKVDNDCCPSAFNTDTGCVCLSDDQKSLMSSRGGNRA
uniref:Uncharacterized protein n=1 Tax=viral metagenome TaxID=1070528 RepID=A0A6C0CJ82_9ZZZZ